MKIKLTTLLLAFTFLSSAFAATQYNIDASHSSVGFKVSHLMISSVQGRFDKFEGNFSFDESTGSLDGLAAKIDLDSVNTNEKKRDAHLKNEDFFNVKKNRWMTFKATKVDVKNKKPNTIVGDLTLNGVTKPVTLNVTYKGSGKDPWGNQRVGFEATGKISRKDYGVVLNKPLEAGGVVVGDEVSILIDGEAVAAK